MKNVFMVKTPLQLINAVEAKHYFKLSLFDCVMIIMGDRKSQHQLLSLAKHMKEWGRVIVLNDVGLYFGNPLDGNKIGFSASSRKSKLFNKSIFNVRRLNRISKNLGSVEKIFIGYSRYVYMRHFVNVTPHNEVILLDDGNATIKLAKERREGKISELHLSAKKKIKKIAKNILQGVKDDDIDSLCFFTIYDVVAGKNDRIVKNSFSHIKSRIMSSSINDVVYFLGSPLDEAGILDQNIYLRHLIRVKNYFKNTNFIYVAHRREYKKNLDVISKILGVEVVLFDYPIEYQLAMIGPRPKIISSFISSAIDNCRDIFGSELKIISFKLDLTASPRKDELEFIYDNYKSKENSNFFVENEY